MMSCVNCYYKIILWQKFKNCVGVVGDSGGVHGNRRMIPFEKRLGYLLTLDAYINAIFYTLYLYR